MSQPPQDAGLIVEFHHKSKELLYLPSKEYMANVHSLCIYPKDLPSKHAISEYPNRGPDPFPEFPDTLKHLRMLHFPFFPSILNIETLTQFALHHDNFPNAPETILIVLMRNPSLKRVELGITFPELQPPSGLQNDHARPKPEYLRFKGSIGLSQLESLWVRGGRPEDTRKLIDLISCISFPENALVDVELSALSGKLELRCALSSIEGFVAPPTCLQVDYYSPQSFEFPGPNGSEFRCRGAEYGEIASALAGESLPFFRKVKNLRLKLGTYLGSPPLKPSLFPSLKTLTIHTETNPRTLSKLLSSPETFSLNRLEIKDARDNGYFEDILFDEDFKQELKQFASKHKYHISSDKNPIALWRGRFFAFRAFFPSLLLVSGALLVSYVFRSFRGA